MRDDWVSPWWQAVNLPALWDVCGVSAPSLSVWHTFALENIGNPYLCGGRPDQDSAASLLLFARLDMAGGQRLIAGPCYRARQMHRMYRRLRKVDPADLDAACREYVETCTRAASRFNAKSGGKPCAVPYQFHIVRRLALSGMTFEQAWNTPYALARCYYDAAAEADGDDSIMTAAAQEMEDNWEDYAPKQKAELCKPSRN